MQTDPTMLAIGFQLTNGKLEEYKSSPVTMTRIYHTATINDAVKLLDYGYLVYIDATDQAALTTIRNHAAKQAPKSKGCMYGFWLNWIERYWS